ncbi:hypothetical protein GOODEAATRI_019552 [Goodea atripinnis]|uniref:Transmembrane protein n=1 Tax=Goodea atripinnis TaxID=208336 RepID=A0ABV0NW42_9TELE
MANPRARGRKHRGDPKWGKAHNREQSKHCNNSPSNHSVASTAIAHAVSTLLTACSFCNVFFFFVKISPPTITIVSSSSAMFIYCKLMFDLERFREISRLTTKSS